MYFSVFFLFLGFFIFMFSWLNILKWVFLFITRLREEDPEPLNLTPIEQLLIYGYISYIISFSVVYLNLYYG